MVLQVVIMHKNLHLIGEVVLDRFAVDFGLLHQMHGLRDPIFLDHEVRNLFPQFLSFLWLDQVNGLALGVLERIGLVPEEFR